MDPFFFACMYLVTLLGGMIYAMFGELEDTYHRTVDLEDVARREAAAEKFYCD